MPDPRRGACNFSDTAAKHWNNSTVLYMRLYNIHLQNSGKRFSYYISNICWLVNWYSRIAVPVSTTQSILVTPRPATTIRASGTIAFVRMAAVVPAAPRYSKTDDATEKPMCFPSSQKLVARVDIVVVHDLNQTEDNGFNDHIDDSDNLWWRFQLHAYDMEIVSVGKASIPVTEPGKEKAIQWTSTDYIMEKLAWNHMPVLSDLTLTPSLLSSHRLRVYHLWTSTTEHAHRLRESS